MKIKLNEFVNSLEEHLNLIVEETSHSEIEVIQDFKEDLCRYVDDAASTNGCSMSNYIFDMTDRFSRRNISVKEVFEQRDGIYEDAISEILSERDFLDVRTYLDLDNIYLDAGFRYFLNIGNCIEDDLLAIYCLKDTISLLNKLDDSLVLDTSNYCEFDNNYTVDDLVDDFVSQIIDKAKSINDLTHMVGYSNDLCNEFFDLDL